MKSDNGMIAVVVDLDELFFGPVYSPRERGAEAWDLVHAVHGELVAAWLRAGVDVVIADGPFLDDAENAALLHAVDPAHPRCRVHLAASFDVALARVAQDEGRGISADPAFLRSTYDRYTDLGEGATYQSTFLDVARWGA